MVTTRNHQPSTSVAAPEMRTSVADARDRTWNYRELVLLVRGMFKHGVGNWSAIREDLSFDLGSHTPGSMVHCLRIIYPDIYKTFASKIKDQHIDEVEITDQNALLSLRPTHLPPRPLFWYTEMGEGVGEWHIPPSGRNAFTEKETERIVELVEKHGAAWAMIARDPLFKGKWAGPTIRDYYKTIRPEAYAEITRITVVSSSGSSSTDTHTTISSGASPRKKRLLTSTARSSQRNTTTISSNDPPSDSRSAKPSPTGAPTRDKRTPSPRRTRAAAVSDDRRDDPPPDSEAESDAHEDNDLLIVTPRSRRYTRFVSMRPPRVESTPTRSSDRIRKNHLQPPPSTASPLKKRPRHPSVEPPPRRSLRHSSVDPSPKRSLRHPSVDPSPKRSLRHPPVDPSPKRSPRHPSVVPSYREDSSVLASTSESSGRSQGSGDLPVNEDRRGDQLNIQNIFDDASPPARNLRSQPQEHTADVHRVEDTRRRRSSPSRQRDTSYIVHSPRFSTPDSHPHPFATFPRGHQQSPSLPASVSLPRIKRIIGARHRTGEAPQYKCVVAPMWIDASRVLASAPGEARAFLDILAGAVPPQELSRIDESSSPYSSPSSSSSSLSSSDDTDVSDSDHV